MYDRIRDHREWACQIRPSNPRPGQRLRSEDFFRPERAPYLVFERGIHVSMVNLSARTVTVDGEGFCVVKRPSSPRTRSHITRSGRVITRTPLHPPILHVCRPHDVNGRELVFVSPTIELGLELIEEAKRAEAEEVLDAQSQTT